MAATIEIRDFPVHGDAIHVGNLRNVFEKYRAYPFDAPRIVTTDGAVVGPYLLAVKDGQVVKGTLPSTKALQRTPCLVEEGKGRFRFTNSASRGEVDGEAVAVGGRALNTLFGWLTSVTPRLVMIKERPDLAGMPFVMRPLENDMQRETLAALGLNPTFRNEDILQAKRFHIPECLILPRGKGQMSPELVANNRRFAQHYLALAKPTRRRRFYLLGGDQPPHQIYNEDELIARLETFGFEAVDLTGLSLRGQISLFASAECIVSPHGGNLAGLCFCEPGTRIVELFFDQQASVSPYWNIASFAGLDYAMVMCKARPRGFINLESTNIIADLDQVSAVLGFAPSEKPPSFLDDLFDPDKRRPAQNNRVGQPKRQDTAIHLFPREPRRSAADGDNAASTSKANSLIDMFSRKPRILEDDDEEPPVSEAKNRGSLIDLLSPQVRTSEDEPEADAWTNIFESTNRLKPAALGSTESVTMTAGAEARARLGVDSADEESLHKFGRTEHSISWDSFYAAQPESFQSSIQMPLTVTRYINKRPKVYREAMQEYHKRLERSDPQVLYDNIVPNRTTRVYGRKYLDIAKHLFKNLVKVRELGFHQYAPLQVLDMGAGAGFFCYAVKCYGHRAVALERPPQDEDGQNSVSYAAISSFFGVPVSQQRIEAQRPIEASGPMLDDGNPQKFDVVTAFAIMFNITQGGYYWETEDYLFLLKDLRDRFLLPGGRVILKFNATLYGEGGERADPNRNHYYRTLGEMLKPFLVYYNHTHEAVLDPFREEAWSKAAAVTLPKTLRPSSADDDDDEDYEDEPDSGSDKILPLDLFEARSSRTTPTRRERFESPQGSASQGGLWLDMINSNTTAGNENEGGPASTNRDSGLWIDMFNRNAAAPDGNEDLGLAGPARESGLLIDMFNRRASVSDEDDDLESAPANRESGLWVDMFDRKARRDDDDDEVPESDGKQGLWIDMFDRSAQSPETEDDDDDTDIWVNVFETSERLRTESPAGEAAVDLAETKLGADTANEESLHKFGRSETTIDWDAFYATEPESFRPNIQMPDAVSRYINKRPRAYREAMGAYLKRLERSDPQTLYDNIVPHRSAQVYGRKYLDLSKHLFKNLVKVRELGFHKYTPLQVLDMGAGAGFFCYAVKCYGHRAVALERPPQDEDGQNSVSYAAISSFFGVPVSQQRIEAQQPIEAAGPMLDADGNPLKFDMVTAFAIMFNITGGYYWETEDYLFLLRDLKDRFLLPGGRVILKFNATLYGEGGDRADPNRNLYYRSLGEMLKPFLVYYNRTHEAVLDVFREEAWEQAAAIRLPKTRRPSSAGEDDGDEEDAE